MEFELSNIGLIKSATIKMDGLTVVGGHNSVGKSFIGKAIYVAFWTFVLNAICKAGYKGFSWFIVLFPLILMAILIGLILLSGMKEGYKTRNCLKRKGQTCGV